MPRSPREVIREATAFLEERIHEINNMADELNEADALTKYTADYRNGRNTTIMTKFAEMLRMLRWLVETERGESTQQPYRNDDEEVRRVKLTEDEL